MKKLLVIAMMIATTAVVYSFEPPINNSDDNNMPVYYYDANNDFLHLNRADTDPINPSYARRTLFYPGDTDWRSVTEHLRLQTDFENMLYYKRIGHRLELEVSDLLLYWHVMNPIEQTGQASMRLYAGQNVTDQSNNGITISARYRTTDLNDLTPNGKVYVQGAENLLNENSPYNTIPTFYALLETSRIPDPAEMIPASDFNGPAPGNEYALPNGETVTRYLWSAVDIDDDTPENTTYRDIFTIIAESVD
ncbi:MAG: hypothetical protein V2A53_01460 [bacterium]